MDGFNWLAVSTNFYPMAMATSAQRERGNELSFSEKAKTIY